MRRSLVFLCGLFSVLALGCGRGDDGGRRNSLLSAYCTAMVNGIGEVEVEADYIPHVVNCENGAAGFEALKAQAVAARSYLYYRLDRTGEIDDSTGDQVYSCGRSPSVLAYMAAEATSGQVLMYRDTQVAAFYVAGAKQKPPNCRGGTRDPTNTEAYVTYNRGRGGHRIEQTSLGFIDPKNHANRGCKSQNGAACLSEMGWKYDRILRFYYGKDIEIAQAKGPCVYPLPPAGDDGRKPAANSCAVARRPSAIAGPFLFIILVLGRRRQNRADRADMLRAAPAGSPRRRGARRCDRP